MLKLFAKMSKFFAALSSCFQHNYFQICI